MVSFDAAGLCRESHFQPIFTLLEIGFAPTNTITHLEHQDLKQNSSLSTIECVVRDESCVTYRQQQQFADIETVMNNRQTASFAMASSTNNKGTPRTFADLSPSKTAPDLQFIALSYKVSEFSYVESNFFGTTFFGR